MKLRRTLGALGLVAALAAGSWAASFWSGLYDEARRRYPPPAEGYHPEVLPMIVRKASEATAARKHPIIIADLDETLAVSLLRAVGLLKEFALHQEIADAFPKEAAAVLRMDPFKVASHPLDVPRVLADIGLAHPDPRFIAELDGYHSHEYHSSSLATDWVMPGALGFVRAASDAGATIIYLTARDEPRMGRETRKWLAQNGLMVRRARLMLKPTPNMDDYAFKKEALERIARMGEVIAGFENEPANINLFADRFPGMIPVFLHTLRSSRPTVPEPRVRWIRDFCWDTNPCRT